MPTEGEPNFDRTDLNESDQIGLTGFKINRIRPGQGNPDQETDDILFFTERQQLAAAALRAVHRSRPRRCASTTPLASNYNIGFLFASGPFRLEAGQTERFSLALAYGADLEELRRTVQTVQQIYNANYRFAVPPPLPTVTAEAGDGFVRLSWDDVAERGVDPVTGEFDFEGYRDLPLHRSRVPRSAGRSRRHRIGPSATASPSPSSISSTAYSGFSEPDGRGGGLLPRHGHRHHPHLDRLQRHQRSAVLLRGDGLRLRLERRTFDFYPSENAIAPSRTPRGGPGPAAPTWWRCGPNPRVLGYVPASADTAPRQSRGAAAASVAGRGRQLEPRARRTTSSRSPSRTPHPDSIRATTYALTDSTDGHGPVRDRSRPRRARASVPVGAGLLPIIATPAARERGHDRHRFRPASPTDAGCTVIYQPVLPHQPAAPGLSRTTSPSIFSRHGGRHRPRRGLRARPIRPSSRSSPTTPAGDRRLDFLLPRPRRRRHAEPARTSASTS